MSHKDPSATPVENPLRVGLEMERGSEPTTVVIFGATGDLTRRKLIPALYNLAWEGLLHPDTSIVGFARRARSHQQFLKAVREALETYSRRRPIDEDVLDQLCSDITYVRGDFGDREAYERLGKILHGIDGEREDPGCHLFYLATPPSAYETIVTNLGRAGLVRGEGGPGATRLVVEKPFGRDRSSAAELNQIIHEAFHEDQVFRIDHYLGKETVQNILVFRLDNGIFEPLWNSHHVDHVQITVAEELGVGTRAGYYEEAGVVRDMLQNHMSQLLSLVFMEPPVRFDAKAVRDEKVKVLRAIRPFSAEQVRKRVIRGQYSRGVAAGREVVGYREEEGVDPDSLTETYLAVKLEVESWRWAGTPIYMRSGKRLPKRATEVDIVFKSPPYDLFETRTSSRPLPNALRLRIQPEEGISLSFQSKAPGQTMHIEEVVMDFSYASSFGSQSPEAYERLLLDAIQGDSTLFAREDEVDLSWALVDRIVRAWAEDPRARPHDYAAGTWGPEAADRLLAADGRAWRRF